jgi:hypothetical protein
LGTFSHVSTLIMNKSAPLYGSESDGTDKEPGRCQSKQPLAKAD